MNEPVSQNFVKRSHVGAAYIASRKRRKRVLRSSPSWRNRRLLMRMKRRSTISINVDMPTHVSREHADGARHIMLPAHSVDIVSASESGKVLPAMVLGSYPFTTVEDDHCETEIRAYRDIVPFLELLGMKLGVSARNLRIYDPFYCDGAAIRHLATLGFLDVYNKCEDFYKVVEEGRIPHHHVVVTNPPYSGGHMERIVRWCRTNGKPFFLLMPDYCYRMPYYEVALGGSEAMLAVTYLYPAIHYKYRTPRGLRKPRVFTLWYFDMHPFVTTKELLLWRQAHTTSDSGALLCRFEELP